MKATVFPDVTTSRAVCKESSIEVIGFLKGISITFLSKRQSHHLIARIRPINYAEKL